MHKAPQSEVREGEKVKPVLIITVTQPVTPAQLDAFTERTIDRYKDVFDVVVVPCFTKVEVSYNGRIDVEYLEVHKMD